MSWFLVALCSFLPNAIRLYILCSKISLFVFRPVHFYPCLYSIRNKMTNRSFVLLTPFCSLALNLNFRLHSFTHPAPPSHTTAGRQVFLPQAFLLPEGSLWEGKLWYVFPNLPVTSISSCFHFSLFTLNFKL